jgi:hypothetical protein
MRVYDTVCSIKKAHAKAQRREETGSSTSIWRISELAKIIARKGGQERRPVRP